MEKELIQNIIFTIQTAIKKEREDERAILIEKGKMNIACLLNELEHKANTTETYTQALNYLRAIKEIKKRTGIYGTIYELFTN